MLSRNIQKTRIRDFSVYYSNKVELHDLKKEIFSERIYDIELSHSEPLIIDIGGNIGLSTLFYKSEYPNSRIIVFEPHPQNFDLLEMNVFQNNLSNVDCVRKAIAASEGEKTLYYSNNHFSSASCKKSAWNRTEVEQEKIIVNSIKLDNFLNERVDLVKMDIEGLEEEVILNSKKALKLISNLIFEFHYSNKGSFDRIVRFLNSCGFRVEGPAKPVIGELYIIKCYKD